MKKLFTGAVIVLMASVMLAVLYAQEAQIFLRPIQMTIGNLGVGTGSIVFEGATGDAFELTLTAEDPTADRSHELPNYASGRLMVTTAPATASGATETLTSDDCGTTILLDTAGGSVVTLPDSTGTGCWFNFVVTVTLTSGTHDIVLANAGDDMAGAVTVITTTNGQADAFFIVDGSDNDTIQMDGNTEGGEAGSVIFIQDYVANVWFVSGTLIGVGSTPTTPFLTAQVS